MAKGNKRKGRRKHGDSSSDDEETDSKKNDDDASQPKDLDFATRREAQRKAALEKRRAKSKCHLCGQMGHVRRECPGVDDGGSGASKFTKSKGDSGAIALKTSNHSKKGAKNRGRKAPKDVAREGEFPPFPAGFSVDTGTSVDDDTKDPFYYYDASCDIMATIEYLCFGRGKNKLSTNEAVVLYQSAIQAATETSNYGGCISRSPLLKPGRPWCKPSLSDDSDSSKEWFVVGLGRDFFYNDSDTNAALSSLLETLSDNDSVIGFFCDLDYSPATTNRPGCDPQSQLQRLECTCQAAADANVTIQIRTSPGVSSAATGEQVGSPYEAVMKDLKQVLVKAIAKHPQLKMYLSCWSGGANHMNSLPEKIWIGFDATVTFAKASHMHECAFDVPLSKLVLETGDITIPSVVAKSMGRNAFSYPGLIPFVADAVAGMKRNDDITAETVARAAANNTLTLYPQLVIDSIEKKETPNG